MNLSEFKAWFEGFTENLDGAPGQKAWEKIQAKVKSITPEATSHAVFIDRYVRPYPYWHGYWYGANAAQTAGDTSYQQKLSDYQTRAGSAGLMGYQNQGVGLQNQACAGNVASFNSDDAFRALGKMEAAA